MSEKKSLAFELLGSFSFGGTGEARAGRKTLSFLQYLVVYHKRSVSSEELIEEFWPERSNNPGGALRRMLFEVRNLLKAMFPEQDDLLLTLSGGYAWNPDVCLDLDTARF